MPEMPSCHGTRQQPLQTGHQLLILQDTMYTMEHHRELMVLLKMQQTGEGGNKGGSCGYIMNAGKRNSINKYGQISLNMLIIISPLILSILHRRTWLATIIMNKEGNTKID